MMGGVWSKKNTEGESLKRGITKTQRRLSCVTRPSTKVRGSDATSNTHIGDLEVGHDWSDMYVE